jgi:PIN domain nuclease of toxin-antitoxin system
VKTVLDSSAILAVLRDEAGAEVVAKRIPDGLVSAVNAVEVIGRLIDLGMNGDEAEMALKELGLEVNAFDAGQGIMAGRLRARTRHLGLSLGDRACLALALQENCKVLTADRAWAQLDIGVEIEVIR